MDSPKKHSAKAPFLLPRLAAGIISGLPPVHAADTFVYFGTHRAGTNIGFSLAHFGTDTGQPASVPHPFCERFLPVH